MQQPKMQNRIADMRMAGYMGVQVNAILAPLLVYKLTASAALAGLALLIEWLPKLGLYLTGGSLASRFGFARTHLTLEGARVIAMLGLLLCALGFGSIWIVAICAAIYQCANATSNILFEVSITKWWTPTEHASGHARMLSSDQWGCMIILLTGLIVSSPAGLALIGLSTQSVAFALTAISRHQMYAQTVRSVTATPLLEQIRRDALSVNKRPLIELALASALIGVPGALIFSSIAFYLNRALPGSTSDATWISTLLLTKTALSLLAISVVRSKLKHGVSERSMALFGFAILIASTSLMIETTPIYMAIISASLLGCGGLLYLPWIRKKRQRHIQELVDENSRVGASGILISVDASSYLVASFLLWSLGSDLRVLTIVAGLLAFIGVALISRPPAPDAQNRQTDQIAL